MKKVISYLSIPLFFILFFFTQNGFYSWVTFLMFIPLFYSFDKNKPHIIIKSCLVFISGIIYYVYNFPWIGKFNTWAIPVLSIFSSFLHFAIPYVILCIIFKKRKYNLSIVFFSAALWTFFEYFLQFFPVPFPYSSVALSLYMNNTLLQILDIVGQFGITFLVVLLNGLLFIILKNIIFFDWMKVLKRSILYIVIMTCWLVYGYISPFLLKIDKKVFIDLAQSSILAKEKTQLNYESYIQYIQKFIDMKDKKSELIIFPETFFYSSINNDNNIIRKYLLNEAKKGDFAISGGFIEDQDIAPFYKANSFFTLGSDNNISVSQKIVLVPFGEYYPLGNMFPELKKMLQERQGSFFFNRGSNISTHNFKNRNGEVINFKVLICYESAFSTLLRATKLSDTDFLVNASSDLWTNSAKALLQNAIFSKFRAIEYRLPIVRVSNGGLSGYINARGKTFLPIPAFSEGNAHVELVKHKHILYNTGTPYSLLGNVIVYICLTYLIVYIVLICILHRFQFFRLKT